MTDTTLKHIGVESRPGRFDVYENESGERYVVIDGLHPNSIKDTFALEHFMLTHYGFFATLYTLLIVATLVYLIGTYIVIPLLHVYRHKRG